jgi:hypothetical protein
VTRTPRQVRRGNPANRFARRENVRQPFETVLLVCEGAKTEPLYFHALRKALNLTSVTIQNTRGTDPVTIVTHAINEMERTDYDRGFCIFDGDASSALVQAALQAIQRSSLPLWPAPGFTDTWIRCLSGIGSSDHVNRPGNLGGVRVLVTPP